MQGSSDSNAELGAELSLAVAPGLNLQLIDFYHTWDLYQLVEQSRSSLKVWLPWVAYIHSPQEMAQLIASYRRKYTAMRASTFVVQQRGCVAGVIGFNYIDWKNKSAALGYWLGAKFRGQGLMQRSCRAVTSYGFTELQLHRIQILCATGNTASQQIPERLNFQKEGCLRQGEWLNGHYEDLFSYAMLAHNWA